MQTAYYPLPRVFASTPGLKFDKLRRAHPLLSEDSLVLLDFAWPTGRIDTVPAGSTIRNLARDSLQSITGTSDPDITVADDRGSTINMSRTSKGGLHGVPLLATSSSNTYTLRNSAVRSHVGTTGGYRIGLYGRYTRDAPGAGSFATRLAGWQNSTGSNHGASIRLESSGTIGGQPVDLVTNQRKADRTLGRFCVTAEFSGITSLSAATSFVGWFGNYESGVNPAWALYFIALERIGGRGWAEFDSQVYDRYQSETGSGGYWSGDVLANPDAL